MYLRTTSISPSPPSHFLCKHAMWKVSDLAYVTFFVYPRNLDIMKYTKLTAFFIVLVSPPPQKKLKLRHWKEILTTLFIKLICDFLTYKSVSTLNGKGHYRH